MIFVIREVARLQMKAAIFLAPSTTHYRAPANVRSIYLANIMGNTFGHLFRITTFGESHGPAVGVVIDGCPPGLDLDVSGIQADLDRRRPGQERFCSPRTELDEVEILSGLLGRRTLGTPIAMLVRSLDARPTDYEALADVFRPGHADYSTEAKYGLRDPMGGGRASGRETIGRVAAGAVARQLLARDSGIDVLAWVQAVGEVRTSSVDRVSITRSHIDASPVRCPDPAASTLMEEAIDGALGEGDTIGGVVEGLARGVPAGWGEPVFDKLTADLAKGLMSIPAARGFEVGEGFASAALRGSEHNDTLRVENGRVVSNRNLAGGLAGGITTGEDLRIRIAFKPPSTIAKPQQTVTRCGTPRTLIASGRHDPCVAPRAVAIVEAMVLLVLADHYLRHRALTGAGGRASG